MMKHVMSSLLGLLCCLQVMAQQSVSGKVTDRDGAALPGATVLVKGTKTGTVTNADGVFRLNLPQNASSLVVTIVGFLKQEVSVGGSNFITVTMKPDNQNLEEIIITGYTNEKKAGFTGAAAKVKDKNIQSVPMGSFDQILQGRVPGLQVTAGSGQPGAAARVQIRGRGSVNGGTAPLYVLDGVPIEEGLFRTLNPNDFESVDVLKDASSAALYGSRGANGVIVITTKKGKAGKTNVSVRNQYGWNKRTNPRFEMMNTAERLQFEEIIQDNAYAGWYFSKKNPRYAGLSDAGKRAADRYLDSLRGIDVNWQDVFFRTGKFRNHELNVSGGNDKTQFFLSGAYFEQQGIALRSDLKRYTVRSNVSHTSGRLKIGFNNTIGYSKSNFIESENAVALANPFAAAYLALPYHSVYRPDGRIAYGGGRTGNNALERLENTTSLTNQFKMVTSMNGRLQITDGLAAHTLVGVDYRQSDNSRFIKPDSYVGSLTLPGKQGSYNTGMNRFFQLVSTSGLDYNKVFNQKHEFNVSAIYEVVRLWTDNFSYTGFGINPKLPNTPAGITAGSTANNLIPTLGGAKNQTGLESIMGVARYTYDNRFSLSGTVRRDGSSKASPSKRYLATWSVGAAWTITNEQFMQQAPWVSFLKLRASYGLLGNNDGFPSDFGYLATYGNSTYGGEQAYIPTAPGNLDYTWERNESLNTGLDFGFLDGRINGNVEYYRRTTKDQFISQQLSRTSGFNSLNLNAGVVRNSGVEYAVNVDVIRSRGFIWKVGVQGAYNKNEVVSLGQVNEFEQGTSIIRVGLPLGSHYAVKWGGVDPATGNPIYYEKDGKTKTNVYNAANSVAEFGTFDAPWIGGFTTDFSYKGFEISALFSYQKGFSRYNNETFFNTYGNAPNNQFNLSKEMLNIWQKPGDITDLQSAATTRQFNSKDIQDASYLRFRNLSIAYNFSNQLVKRTGILQFARIYAMGQNLYTWTKWRGTDPEDNNNIAQYEYPATATYTIGLDLTF